MVAGIVVPIQKYSKGILMPNELISLLKVQWEWRDNSIVTCHLNRKGHRLFQIP
jgi:hypothetical protein